MAIQGEPRGPLRVARLVIAIAVVVVTAACSTTNTATSTATSTPTTAGPGTTASPSSTSATPGTAPGTTSGTERTGPSAETLYAGYASAVYAEPKHWLCGPAGSLDICRGDLTTTSIDADGTLHPLPHPVAADPKIDCFYVYPTISADQTPNSDLEPGATEFSAVLAQAARFDEVCRVFAPVYRQNTIASLMGTIESDVPAERRYQIAYDDVVDSWHHYLAHENDGRGVVLMGHSQGGSMLTRLIKDEIDDRPEVRARVVSALVIGSDLEVPEGKDVGGDFQHIPLCRTAGQVGCAIGYSTFRSTAPPPPDSYFGRPSADSTGRQVACVNPAALAGGEATVHPYFPTPMRPGAMPDLAPVTTPYLTFPGMLSAECVLENGFSYLRVTVHADPSDPRPDDIAGDLTPVWGLHLVDVHLALGDLIEVVRAQAAAWPTS